MSDFWGDRGDALMAKARTSPLFSAKDDRLRTNKAGPIRLAQDDTRKATGRAEATAKCGVPFDFAQGRLLHCATDDETVRRFGRDDDFWAVQRRFFCRVRLDKYKSEMRGPHSTSLRAGFSTRGGR
jgi:hypothetical protein